MTPEQAQHVIDTLEQKHRLFKSLSIQAHDKGFFVTFEQIDLDPKTVYHWFEAAGVYPLYMGSEGTGDRRVMCAEVRI